MKMTELELENLHNILLAIRDGYDFKILDNGYVMVQNPKYKESDINIESPFNVFQVTKGWIPLSLKNVPEGYVLCKRGDDGRVVIDKIRKEYIGNEHYAYTHYHEIPE